MTTSANMRFVAFLLLVAGCAKESLVDLPPMISPPEIPVYNVTPPAGKLPWPHHNPGFTQAEYDKMMSDLFIINNFGQYQAGDTRESAYFHDGLDVVAPNDTKIYAVDSGYVKAITGTDQYYMTIIIADVQNAGPGKAWTYTHVNNFKVKVGDHVPQGRYIADIHFMGVPHVHLNRAYFSSGSWSNWGDLNFVQPDTFFVYNDADPPVIERPFYYFRNKTDTLIAQANPPIVSGDIDIAVGLREQGAYAHAKDGTIVPEGFGDRLAVSRLEWEVLSEGKQVYFRKSFDFSKIVFNYRPDGYQRVFTVYKFYPIIRPEKPSSYSKIFTYYVITNVDGTGEFGEIKITDADNAWNTRATGANGKPLFPNGKYAIRVMAYDVKGNHSSESDTVEVRN
jgi:hypothetical protein